VRPGFLRAFLHAASKQLDPLNIVSYVALAAKVTLPQRVVISNSKLEIEWQISIALRRSFFSGHVDFD
jgi:hypothetical protein